MFAPLSDIRFTRFATLHAAILTHEYLEGLGFHSTLDFKDAKQDQASLFRQCRSLHHIWTAKAPFATSSCFPIELRSVRTQRWLLESKRPVVFLPQNSRVNPSMLRVFVYEL